MAMDQATHQRWWALHLRVARGEDLSAEERTFYETMGRRLEQEETIGEQALELRKSREMVASLERERSALEARRRQLDAEIASLEATLSKQMQQPLGVEG
jgi:predicted RNase H-like nuclease (RuvC/YqgF family)